MIRSSRDVPQGRTRKARSGGTRPDYNVQKGTATPKGWQGAQYGQWQTVELNRRTKRGARYVREARKLLEDDEWIVCQAAQVTRVNAGRWRTLTADFWKVFDLGCRKPGRLKFVQVTHGRTNVSGHAKKIRTLLPAPLAGEEWEVWERRLQGEDGHRPAGRAPAFRIKTFNPVSRTWTVTAFLELARKTRE